MCVNSECQRQKYQGLCNMRYPEIWLQSSKDRFHPVDCNLGLCTMKCWCKIQAWDVNSNFKALFYLVNCGKSSIRDVRFHTQVVRANLDQPAHQCMASTLLLSYHILEEILHGHRNAAINLKSLYVTTLTSDLHAQSAFWISRFKYVSLLDFRDSLGKILIPFSFTNVK